MNIDRKKLAEIISNHMVGRGAKPTEKDITNDMLNLYNKKMGDFMKKYPKFDVDLDDYSGEEDDEFIENVLIPTAEKGGIDIFESEDANESVDLGDRKSISKLFKGHPVTFQQGEADGRDYNAYLKAYTTNMDDSTKEAIIRDVRKVKISGVNPNNIHIAPNNGGGVTLTIKYFDDSMNENVNEEEVSQMLKDESDKFAIPDNKIDAIYMHIEANHPDLLPEFENVVTKYIDVEQSTSDRIVLLPAKIMDASKEIRDFLQANGMDLNDEHNVIMESMNEGKEYHIEVSVRDARKALDILNDRYRRDYKTDGSNYYIFKDQEMADAALQDLIDAKVEIASDSVNEAKHDIITDKDKVKSMLDGGEKPEVWISKNEYISNYDDYGKKYNLHSGGFVIQKEDDFDELWSRTSLGKGTKSVNEDDEFEKIDESQEGWGDIQDYYNVAKEAVNKNKIKGLSKIYQGKGDPINYDFKFIDPINNDEVIVAYNIDLGGIEVTIDGETDDLSIAGFRTYLFEEVMNEALTDADVDQVVDDIYDIVQDSETRGQIENIIQNHFGFDATQDQVDGIIAKLRDKGLEIYENVNGIYEGVGMSDVLPYKLKWLEDVINNGTLTTAERNKIEDVYNMAKNIKVVKDVAKVVNKLQQIGVKDRKTKSQLQMAALGIEDLEHVEEKLNEMELSIKTLLAFKLRTFEDVLSNGELTDSEKKEVEKLYNMAKEAKSGEDIKKVTSAMKKMKLKDQASNAGFAVARLNLEDLEDLDESSLMESVDAQLAGEIADDLLPKLQAKRKKGEKVAVKDLEDLIKKGGGNLMMTDLVMSELVSRGFDFDIDESVNESEIGAAYDENNDATVREFLNDLGVRDAQIKMAHGQVIIDVPSGKAKDIFQQMKHSGYFFDMDESVKESVNEDNNPYEFPNGLVLRDGDTYSMMVDGEPYEAIFMGHDADVKDDKPYLFSIGGKVGHYSAEEVETNIVAEEESVTDEMGEPVTETLIPSAKNLKVGRTYLTPSGLGGAFVVEYKGVKDGKHLFENVNEKSKYFGGKYAFTDASVIREIHESMGGSETYMKKKYGNGSVYTGWDEFHQALSYMTKKDPKEVGQGDISYYQNDKGDNIGVWDHYEGAGMIFESEDVEGSEDSPITLSYDDVEQKLTESNCSEEQKDEVITKLVQMDEEEGLGGQFSLDSVVGACKECGIDTSSLESGYSSSAVSDIGGGGSAFEARRETKEQRQQRLELEAEAKADSKNGYTQHVNRDVKSGNYYISDWYDYEETVSTFFKGETMMMKEEQKLEEALKLVGEDMYKKMKDIVDHGYQKVQGKTVDSFTASAVVQVADALNAENRKKFLDLPLPKLVEVTWRVLKK